MYNKKMDQKTATIMAPTGFTVFIALVIYLAGFERPQPLPMPEQYIASVFTHRFACLRPPAVGEHDA